MPSKTIQQWQQVIKDEIAANATLSAAFTNNSAFAIWNLIAYIGGVTAFAIDSLFDAFRADVNNTLTTMKPHTLKWYATRALQYQNGATFVLAQDQDYYDNTGIADSVVADSKKIKYAAVTEVAKGLLIKIAGQDGTDLAPVTPAQLTGFAAYMDRIKDAGIHLYYTNATADRLVLGLDIYYDALILNKDGQRLDGTDDTPVQDAIANFLKNQPFNGLFVLNMLIDSLQVVEGVIIPHITTAQASYGALPLTDIQVEYLPDAGYMRCNSSDLSLNFIAHEPI